MSIVIDTNLDFLVSKLGISASKIQEQYAGQSVEDIVEAEAAQGNQAAIKLANELLNNVALVIELFGLANPENKLAILSEMTTDQMYKFLPLMEKKDLVQGLNFFTMEKLMKMAEDLPPEQLVKFAFEMFSEREIVKLMPEDQLNKFLEDTQIDKSDILKQLKSMPPQYLAQMIESVTGQPVQGNMDSYDLTKQLGGMNPLQFQDSLRNMQPAQKQELVLNLGKQHPEWFQIFDAHAYTTIIQTQKDKPDVIKAAGVLEQEHLEKMIQQLPDDLLAVVITQMDTKVFAETLMRELPEIMAQIITK